ncbi:putative D-amino acid oxidase [Marinobacterium nitratireducens]|uniref:D-amino acid oxidase n=1 Tax=Marinobacterium nitratireducens TaxID=518897 RepID=A0A917ZPK3_9GAMM|nr:glycine oxidase ThiO [Marinobacterium nitratireducens]GGO88239.1 putative D-amino acid oxidase [Marinobacterium nitratireducens]
MSDFLVVGGGVIGMLTARELAQSGASVTLVERGLCARESTWAGGGIVSPLYPWRYKEPVTQLATWSQSSYIHLSQDLFEETGIDPELRQKGMFMVSVDDEAEALEWAARFRRPMLQVDAEFLYRKEPHLRPGHERSLWMPEVASIRNPRLGQALRRSLELNPRIELIEQAGSAELLLDGEQVVGVRTDKGEFRAGQTVLAAGAWTGELLAPLGLELPVEPVKGQMMLFKAPVGLVNRVVLLGGRYLIPRNDGRVLVGSTLERVGFDKQATEDARDSLYRTAIDILPQLADYPVEHHWAGLRPGSPEGIPFIGAVPGYRGLHVNAGQYRNGLVLAPASTRLMADLLLDRTPIIDPEPYRLSGRLALN